MTVTTQPKATATQVSSPVIHAFDPDRRTNSQLMLDCLQLEYLPEPIVDLTYGKGAFWGDQGLAKLDVWANDIDPTKGRDSQFDFCSLPSSWGRTCDDPYGPDPRFVTSILDVPYRMGGLSSRSSRSFDQAYGTAVARTAADIRGLIEKGCAEACRVAAEFVIVKVQNHISSGRLQPQVTWAINAAEASGGRLVDELHVVAGRAQPAGVRQVRARHGYSTALIFSINRTPRKAPQQAAKAVLVAA